MVSHVTVHTSPMNIFAEPSDYGSIIAVINMGKWLVVYFVNGFSIILFHFKAVKGKKQTDSETLLTVVFH